MCCWMYKGEIVIPSVHLSLMYLFNFSYNYITIIRIGPLPLGNLQLPSLLWDRVQVLINMLLTYYLCVCHQSNVIYCFQYC